MRARVKADKKEALEQMVQAWEQQRGTPDGYHSSEVAWEEGDPNRVLLIVHFRDKESYVANAESPDQDAEYRQMLDYLEAEPEWIDVNYGAYHGSPLPA